MLQTGDTECKIRGFTLDEQGSALLHFESIERHILADIKDPEEKRRTMQYLLASTLIQTGLPRRFV